MCREKTRKAKLNLITTVKKKKKKKVKCFKKIISNRRKARETKDNVHPLLSAGENADTQAETLNTVFASVFNSQTSYPRSIQPPELEDRDEREQSKVP